MLIDRDFTELFADDDADILPAAPRASERRRAPRIPIAVNVDVAAPDPRPTHETFFGGLTADVSEHGVFVATPRVLDVGTRVSLEISLPTGQVLARGVVRWKRAACADRDIVAGLGIVFDGLCEIDQRTIVKFCADRPRFITYEEVRAALA
jgi:hypothetical protein